MILLWWKTGFPEALLLFRLVHCTGHKILVKIHWLEQLFLCCCQAGQIELLQLQLKSTEVCKCSCWLLLSACECSFKWLQKNSVPAKWTCLNIWEKKCQGQTKSQISSDIHLLLPGRTIRSWQNMQTDSVPTTGYLLSTELSTWLNAGCSLENHASYPKPCLLITVLVCKMQSDSEPGASVTKGSTGCYLWDLQH